MGSPGFDSVVKMDDTGGVLQTLTGYFTGADVSYDQDVSDTSVTGTKGKQKTAGQDDAKVTLNGPWSAVVEAWIGPPSTWTTLRTFEYYPTGVETGERKQSFEAIIKSYKPPTKVDDAVRFTLELEKSGNATWSVNA